MGLASSSCIRKAVALPGPALWLAHSILAGISVLSRAIGMGTFTTPRILRSPEASMLGATLEAREATFFYRCFLLFCMSCWAPGGTVFVATSPIPLPPATSSSCL